MDSILTREWPFHYFADAATRPLACSSGHRQRFGQTPPLGQLEEVVDGADDGPLGAYFFEAAQQELTETAGLFDLSEHRLGQLLAQPVGARVPAGLDLRAHSLYARRFANRLRRELRGGGLVCDRAGNGVSGPAGRHIGIDVAVLQRLEIGLRAVAGVRR